MLIMDRSMTGDGQTYAFENALAVQRERLDTRGNERRHATARTTLLPQPSYVR
jgi:hypothetical protein